MSEVAPAIAMNKVKSIGAGLLLLLGFWCLGRALETSLNRDPRLLDKRETITAGLLLGVPATTGGSWLLWERRRQRREQAAQHLRQTFFSDGESGTRSGHPVAVCDGGSSGWGCRQCLSPRSQP